MNQSPPSLRVRLRLLTTALAICGLAGCATERSFVSKSEELAATGKVSESLANLQAGLKQNPESVLLRTTILKAHDAVVNDALADAQVKLKAGDVKAAQASVDKALNVEKGNARLLAAAETLRVEGRQLDALAEANAWVEKKNGERALAVVEEGLKDNPSHAGLLALQRQLEADRHAAQVKAGLAALDEVRPISLDFKDAALRTVLDAVTRNSGVNFILDKDVRLESRVTIFLTQARVEDALDLIASTNQLAKKVLDAKTIVIYPNTAEKQKEYQEQVVRVFYLSGSEAKGAAAFLKSMLKIREPFVEERTNMLAVRDSVENVALAERLVSLYDAGEPEVLLEVEVMELAATRLNEIGIKFPDTFSLTPVAPGGADGLTLGNIRSLTKGDINVAIGGVAANFKREVGDVTTLANPRIRARNKEKASVLIGDKIPVVTSTTGTGGFVSDSVTYLDVGLKLNVEPTVYADGDVAIKVALEVSTLGAAVKTNSGTLAYQIGTRNANTLLRLHDGETQVLAGLISKEDRTSSSRVPGAGDLPVLGRLFSNQQDTNNRSELVLSITPHVLRNIKRPDASESELWIGTEASPRFKPNAGYKALPKVNAGQPTGPAGAPAAAGAAGAPQLGAPASNSTGGTTPGTDSPAAPVQPTTVSLEAPASVKKDETFEVKVLLDSKAELRGLPVELAFAKDKLALIEVAEGTFFKQGNTATSFSKTPTPGQVNFGVIRNQASGASGKGLVATLKFKALATGAADIHFNSAKALGVTAPVADPVLAAAVKLDIQ